MKKDFRNKHVIVVAIDETADSPHDRLPARRVKELYEGELGFATSIHTDGRECHDEGYIVRMRSSGTRLNLGAGELRLAPCSVVVKAELSDQLHEIVTLLAGDALESIRNSSPGSRRKPTARALAEVVADHVEAYLEEGLESLTHSGAATHEVELQRDVLKMWKDRSCRSLLLAACREYV